MAINRYATIVAVFENQNTAERAINELQSAGIGAGQLQYARPGSVEGGLYSPLTSNGVPDEDARYYDSEYNAGHPTLLLNTQNLQQNDVQTALDILNRNGAYDATRRGSQGSTYAGEGGNQRMELREEQLQANKQTVERGQVRLGKDVVEEEQTFNVPVSHDEVYIQRHPSSGQVSDMPINEESANESYQVPIREEEVNVQKTPVVREEVELGKRSVQENQRVSDTVRREEARIDRDGDVEVQRGQNNLDR